MSVLAKIFWIALVAWGTGCLYLIFVDNAQWKITPVSTFKLFMTAFPIIGGAIVAFVSGIVWIICL